MTWFQRHQNTGVPTVTPRVTLSTATELNAQQKGESLLEIIVRRHDAHFLPFLVELVSVHHSLPLCAASLESAKTPSEAPARDPEGGPGCCIFSKNNGEQSRGTYAFQPCAPPSSVVSLRQQPISSFQLCAPLSSVFTGRQQPVTRFSQRAIVAYTRVSAAHTRTW